VSREDYSQVEVRSHLDCVRPGDIYLGFDLNNLTIEGLEDCKSRPEVVLIRRKKENRRIYKLKRMDIEKAGGLKKGVDEKPEKGFEEFMEQLDQDKEMRTKVNLFKDLEAVEEKKKLKLLKRTENKK
jgi:nonsense-mediated mRNA decay protein 3